MYMCLPICVLCNVNSTLRPYIKYMTEICHKCCKSQVISLAKYNGTLVFLAAWLMLGTSYVVHLCTSLYTPIKYMTYMCHLVGIFVSTTYIAIRGNKGVVGFVLIHVCTIIRSVCPCRMRIL